MADNTSLKTAVGSIVQNNGVGIFRAPGELRKLLVMQGISEECAITVELMLSSCPALANALAGGVITRSEANTLVSLVIQKTSLTPAVTRKIVGELFQGRGIDPSEYSIAGELKKDSDIGEKLSASLQKKGYQWSLIDDSEERMVTEARIKLFYDKWQDAALSELDRMAEAGNAESNYAVGEYLYGLSLKNGDQLQGDSHYVLAKHYMERSAKLGYGPAFGALAEMEILSPGGSLEKAAGYLRHPISIKGRDGRKWSGTVDWMMNYQYDNSKRANSVLIIILTALIVSVFACTVRPVFGILGCVLSARCLGRVVFSKFWNKYLSHVPEMALLTVVWFLIILALL